MPPCVYRSGMNDDGTFRYYSTILEQLSNPRLRLYLYHFPYISGVPINPQARPKVRPNHIWVPSPA